MLLLPSMCNNLLMEGANILPHERVLSQWSTCVLSMTNAVHTCQPRVTFKVPCRLPALVLKSNNSSLINIGMESLPCLPCLSIRQLGRTSMVRRIGLLGDVVSLSCFFCRRCVIIFLWKVPISFLMKEYYHNGQHVC